MKRVGKLLGISGLIVGILCGCSGEVSDDINVGAGETENTEVVLPLKENRDSLTFAFYRDDIADTNPHLYHSELWAQEMLFDTLVSIEPTGIEPALAESWEITDEGKTYTFKIREGVTFTDGVVLDANAVKANFDAIWDNKERHVWLESMKLITEYYAEDDYTFVIKLSAPYYPMLNDLGVTRPFAMASPNAMKEGTTKDGLIEPIGSGTYIMDEYKPGEYVTYIANEDYWGEIPEIKKVTMKIIPDNQTRVLALENGEIDLIYGAELLDADTLFAYEENEEFTPSTSEPLSTRQIILNAANPILGDINVRYALSHAVNKQAISEGIFYGMEAPADFLYSPTIPYCDVELEPYAYDTELAKEYLEKAGWVEGADGIRTKGGQRLSLKVLYDNNSVTGKIISEYLQSEYLNIGIEIKIEGLERNTYFDALKAGDFDIAHNIAWGTPYDPQSSLAAMKGPVYGDYAAQLSLPNKVELDQAITDVFVTTDEVSRQALYDDILTMLHESAIYIPLTYENNKALYSSDLEGVNFKPSQYTIPFWEMSFK